MQVCLIIQINQMFRTYDKMGDIIFKSNKLILPRQQLFINYGDKYWENRKDKI